ncbi:MAG: hypothetical protein ACFFAO_16595 [Candidatus Hermodarchaeota archaeon]
MKKIWIIHNSRFGNSENIAKLLANRLKDSYDTNVSSIKNISPEDIAREEPYGMIFAVRILSFMSDRKIRSFISKMDKELTKPISKVAYFSTHAMNWREGFIKGMKRTLDKISCVGEICPEYLNVRVQGNKGPVVEGSDLKIGEFISTLKEFLK